MMQPLTPIESASQKNRQAAHHADVFDNKVDFSRFIFYLKGLAIIVFLIVCCYALYTHSFKKSVVNINESSLFVPQYK